MPVTDSYKTAVHQHLVSMIGSRMSDLRARLEQMTADRNSETKSSAGDKYETGRAMMQQEIDMCQAELLKNEKLLSDLERLDPQQVHATITAGSLVTTDHGIYYIAVGLGRVAVNGTDCFAISPGSPFGMLLGGKKPGDTITLQDNTYTIISIQ